LLRRGQYILGNRFEWRKVTRSEMDPLPRPVGGSHLREGAAEARPGVPFTLGVDIGGTYMKAAVLDCDGGVIAERIKAPTPKPATPEAILSAIDRLTAQFPAFDRVSVGFPGVVSGGSVVTAPNLGTGYWAGYKLIDALAGRFEVPVRLLNDAAVQGLGVVEGHGLECVITLGTGVGCALFRKRRLLLHLEFGQHRRMDQIYDQYIGQAGLTAAGVETWNERVRESVKTVIDLTNCDVLYIGGGNARRLAGGLPPQVRIVSNAAGVTGGVRLWEPDMDEFFVGEVNAQWPSQGGGMP
jgi:polyphosphate glucokinase